MEDAHAEQLAEFTTDEALDQFRSSRLEECRIHKTFVSFSFFAAFSTSSQIKWYVNGTYTYARYIGVSEQSRTNR